MRAVDVDDWAEEPRPATAATGEGLREVRRFFGMGIEGSGFRIRDSGFRVQVSGRSTINSPSSTVSKRERPGKHRTPNIQHRTSNVEQGALRKRRVRRSVLRG